MTQELDQFNCNHLNHLQIGRIGEYWVKIWLTLFGFDAYTNDVDDKGIDFVIRLNEEKHVDIQVKTMRGDSSYVFVNKESWKSGLRRNLYLALVILKNNTSPKIYFIPSTDWFNPNDLLRYHDYSKEGQTSKPDWGINVSRKNMEILKQYQLSSL
jgi:hypothetical protein